MWEALTILAPTPCAKPSAYRLFRRAQNTGGSPLLYNLVPLGLVDAHLNEMDTLLKRRGVCGRAASASSAEAAAGAMLPKLFLGGGSREQGAGEAEARRRTRAFTTAADCRRDPGAVWRSSPGTDMPPLSNLGRQARSNGGCSNREPGEARCRRGAGKRGLRAGVVGQPPDLFGWRGLARPPPS